MNHITSLKNRHKEESVLLLGAGPSLSDFSLEELKEIAKDKVVIAIKQALDKYPKADYHILNDNNLKYYNYNPKPIVLASHAANVNNFYLKSIADYFFLIDQNTDYSQSLSCTLNFDEETLENKPYIRRFGPGVMWELAIPFCYHIGIANIYSVGIDLAKKGDRSRKHFYKNTVINPAHLLTKEEADNEINLSGYFFRWLRNNGVDWFVLSRNSYLHPDIPRLQPQDILVY